MRAIFCLLTITLSAVTAASGCGNGCLGEKEKVSPSENPFEDQVGLDPIGEECKDLPVAEQLKQIALNSQIAGYVGGNVDDYINPWSTKGAAFFQRKEEDKRYAHKFDRNQLESSRRILFSPGGILADSLEHTHAECVIEGEKGTLKVEAVYTSKGTTQIFSETYDFVQAPRGWEIVRKRSWPIRMKEGGLETTYNRSVLMRLDTAVTLAQKEKNSLLQADALEAAFRYNEAYTQRAKYTQEKTNATASEWIQLGYTSLSAGHISSAMRCFENARDLDADILLPEGGLVLRLTQDGGEYTDEEIANTQTDTKGPDKFTPTDTMDEEEEPDAGTAPGGDKEGKESPGDDAPPSKEAEAPTPQKAPEALAPTPQKAPEAEAPTPQKAPEVDDDKKLELPE